MLNTAIQIVTISTYLILVITGSGGGFDSLNRERNTAEEALKLVHREYRNGEMSEDEMEEQIEDILCWAVERD